MQTLTDEERNMQDDESSDKIHQPEGQRTRREEEEGVASRSVGPVAGSTTGLTLRA